MVGGVQLKFARSEFYQVESLPCVHERWKIMEPRARTHAEADVNVANIPKDSFCPTVQYIGKKLLVVVMPR